MTTTSIKAQRAASRKIAWAISALTAVSVAAVIAVVMLFTGLNEREQAVAASIKEDAIWAAFQADREASRLIEAIVLAQTDPSPEMLRRVETRYDILYSRTGLFEGGKFAVKFQGTAPVARAAAQAYDSIIAFDAVLSFALQQGDQSGPALAALLDDALAIRNTTETLLIAAQAATNEARVSERLALANIYWEIALGVILLTFTLGAIVILMAIQLVYLTRSGQELRRLSAESDLAARAALEGSRAKSTFLATMSHEIRSPLNGIIGMAEILDDGSLSAGQRDKVQKLRGSGELLLDVINDILDFSKLEAGAIDHNESRVSIGSVLESIDSLLRPRASVKGIELVYSGPSVSFVSDGPKVRQILLNLVGNAIKFTDKGSVEVEWTKIAGGLRFAVTDSGIGIDGNDQSRLFKEFSQIDDGSNRRYGGTGLGLIICKRLAEALGGDIGVESAPGRGSTFWFTIAARDITPDPTPARPNPALTASSPSRFAAKVLVVDDNDINREVACTLLTRLGIAAECANDGEVAIQMIGKAEHDLVFMDMQMPGTDGLAATRELRRLGCMTPIVGLTANAFVTDRQLCLEAGMNDFMAKPITTEKLVRCLELWLPKSTGRRDAVNIELRAALSGELGAELLETLTEKLLTQSMQTVDSIEAGQLASDNAQKWDAALHSLKGAADTLGFSAIAKAAHDSRHLDTADALVLLKLALADARRAVAATGMAVSG